MTDVTDLLKTFVGEKDTRVKVLESFLQSPNTSYYPAELAILLHCPESSVRRALHFLARCKILISNETRYRHYFQLHSSWRKMR